MSAERQSAREGTFDGVLGRGYPGDEVWALHIHLAMTAMRDHDAVLRSPSVRR